MSNYSKIKGLKIGITGCSGVLGNRLIQILTSYGADITCLVRASSKIDSVRELQPRFVYGDITDRNSLPAFVRNLDVCIHLAAYVGHGSMKDYRNVNVSGTKNLCETILENNPNCRFINCSSIAALRIKKGLKLEYTNYSKSKKLADDVVAQITAEKGLKTTTVFPGLFYGPCDVKFIPTLMKSLQSGKVFFLTGGEKNAPVIYIDDLCDLFVKVIMNENTVGKRYIGVGLKELGIHEVFRIIARKLSIPEPDKVRPKLPYLTAAILFETVYGFFGIKKSPPITRRIVDILSINFDKDQYGCDSDIDWTPKVRFNEGLSKFFAWYSDFNKEFGIKYKMLKPEPQEV